MSHRKFRPLALALAATAVALVAPAPASAGLLVDSAPGCDNGPTSQVFAPWLDFGHYFQAPNGDVEGGAAGWTLDGGASVVEDSANLTGPGSQSVGVPAGSSATSPTACVGVGDPTLRFMVKKTGGGLLASLRVEVLVEDNLGVVDAVPVGSTGGGSSWQPSAPMLVVANLLPLLPGDHTPVGVRFVPQGGSWQVDDLHIDPPRKP